MKCYHTRLTTGHEGDAGKIGICCKHYCHHYPGGLQRQWTVMNNMKTVFFTIKAIWEIYILISKAK